MQDQVQEQVKRINTKLQQLLKQYQQLQKENNSLQQKLQVIQQEAKEKTKKLEELEQKVAVLKTATNNLTDDDKKELEKRLNRYIKEIDRCINMLSEK